MDTDRFDPAGAFSSRNSVCLELGIHGCIETTARRVRQALVDALLAGRLQGAEAEDALELLTAFLAESDFWALRSHDPDLDGRIRVMVEVARLPDGTVAWRKRRP